MWIKLSNCLYFFGEGGITKIVPNEFHNTNPTEWITVLYNQTHKVDTVKESIEEIEKMLSNPPVPIINAYVKT